MPEGIANQGKAEVDAGLPGINPPELDERTLKATRRSIGNEDQALRICDSMFNPQNNRNTTNGIIADKYNDSPPFARRDLEQNGELWRHNFSTGFMSTFVNRIVPVPVSMIDGAQYLTSARLSFDRDPDGKKSEAFQREITKLCRSWKGWRSFIYALCQELVLFGYAISVCLDKYEWRPRFFRQDEFGVPDGCGQHADDAQFIGLKQSFLIHEMVEQIKNKKAAERFWNIPNAVEAINTAWPAHINDRSTNNANNPRTYTDLVREGNLGVSYDAQASLINCYHFYAREADEGVSHYVLHREKTKKLLFERVDEFKNMSDFMTLFSLEPGNGKLYGSKGLGRKLINLHLAAERARVRMCDQHYLASTIVLQSEKGMPTVQFKVRHPFTVFGSDATVQENAMPTNVQAFLELDERLSSYAESIIGDYMPDKLGQGAREQTAREVMARLQKEQSQKVAYIQRFFGQFGDCMSMITRRACDPATNDKEAKAMQKRMAEAGLNPEDIKDLAAMPANEVIHDVAQMENQQVVSTINEVYSSPLVDKVKALRIKIIAEAGPRGPHLADEIIIPNSVDPNVEAEQIRQQITENIAIANGAPGMPVSDRDDHKIHLKVMKDEFDQSEAELKQNKQVPHPKILDNFSAGLAHMKAHADKLHVKAAGEKNKQDEAIAKFFLNYVKQKDRELMAVGQHIRQQAAQQQPGAQPPAPPIPQGGAPQPPAAGGAPSPNDHPALQNFFGKPVHAEHLKIALSIPYDKAPETIRRQIEAAAGFEPANGAKPENHWGADAKGGAQAQPQIPLTPPQPAATPPA